MFVADPSYLLFVDIQIYLPDNICMSFRACGMERRPGVLVLLVDGGPVRHEQTDGALVPIQHRLVQRRQTCGWIECILFIES